MPSVVAPMRGTIFDEGTALGLFFRGFRNFSRPPSRRRVGCKSAPSMPSLHNRVLIVGYLFWSVGCSSSQGAPAQDGGDNAQDAGTDGSTDSSDAASEASCVPSDAPAPSGAVTVNACSREQPIDGFGASDAFSSTALTPDQVTLFFDSANGIGLSLLRVGIDGDGTPLGSAAYADATAASKFGVKVWGTPWSPPAADKSNGSVDNGGTLNTNAYDSWASVLAGFPATFKQNTGVDLYAVSAQNEPDYLPTYQSCTYSAEEMVAFAKVLGPKLAALDPPVKLLAPEAFKWSDVWTGVGYGNAIVADPDASAAVSIVATHDYGFQKEGVTRPAPPHGLKQHVWVTEVGDLKSADVDIAEGIEVATWIHAALTTGRVSAWHYWWLVSRSSTGLAGPGLLPPGGSTTAPPKRLYTVGNYSKFIRPGYVAVDVTGTAQGGVLLSAYEDPVNGTIVVVAVNPQAQAQPLAVFVSGGKTLTKLTPYVTSATQDLEPLDPIAITSASFGATLGAQSVTTFVSD